MLYQLGDRDGIWRESNPRPTAPEAGALSTELQIHVISAPRKEQPEAELRPVVCNQF